MLEKRKGIPAKKGYFKDKSGRTVRYDSMTELAMMMYMDENNVSWEKNTKLRIPYVFKGKERKYIPDFIVEERRTAFGDIAELKRIIEVKGSNDKPELPFKCAAAEEYCRENGMEFSLVPYDKVLKLIDWKLVQQYHKNQENGI